MNTALWILQAILSIKFISVAITHGIRFEKAEMQSAIEKMGPTARPLLMVIAILTLTGALGLILPAVTEGLTWITPFTALILAGLMLGSIIFHINYREKPAIFADVILFMLTALVAYGRWILSPL